jgi:hypothetical protein
MKLRELELPFWFDARRAGASRDQIEQLEREAGVELPEEFRQALMLRDGGTSNYASFRRDDYQVPIPSFFTVEELRRAERHREELGTLRGIVAIAGGGHEWLGLDYRHGPVPTVVFQEDEDAPLEAVADSFEALLDGLTED